MLPETVDVLDVVVPPSTAGPVDVVLDVPPSTAEPVDVVLDVPITDPSIVPVQTALKGQQATCPASSVAQLVPEGQQTVSAPRFEQEL